MDIEKRRGVTMVILLFVCVIGLPLYVISGGFGEGQKTKTEVLPLTATILEEPKAVSPSFGVVKVHIPHREGEARVIISRSGDFKAGEEVRILSHIPCGWSGRA